MSIGKEEKEAKSGEYGGRELETQCIVLLKEQYVLHKYRVNVNRYRERLEASWICVKNIDSLEEKSKLNTQPLNLG